MHVIKKGTEGLFSTKTKGRTLGGRRKEVCDLARNNGNILPETPRCRRVHEQEAERATDQHGAKASIDEWSPGGNPGENSSGRLGLR